MKKCHDLAKIFVEEYNAISHKKLPQLKFHSSDKPGEKFYSHYAAKTVSVEADNPLALVYGLNQIIMGVKTGHLAEHLGEQKPRFPLRPVWLKSDTKIIINPNLSLYLPNEFLDENASNFIPQFCKRLIECGYNAVLFGSQSKCEKDFSDLSSTESTIDLNQHPLQGTLSLLHGYGIKVLLKPTFSIDNHEISPYSEKFIASLKASIDALYNLIPSFDALFWESFYLSSGYYDHPKASDATECEIVLEEVRLLEKSLRQKSRLIFFLPLTSASAGFLQARWMTSLVDDMGKGTILSFNAVQGEVHNDHAREHPLWEHLRKTPDSSSTPFLPIVNVGLVKQGEGLWPISNFDLLERFIPRCSRHRYAGIVAYASYLPQAGSLLDCNFWVAGQSLWSSSSPSLLAESWFHAFRPQEEAYLCLESMKRARSIAIDLSYLRVRYREHPLNGEEAKTYGEALLSQLTLLRMLWKEKKGPLHTSLPTLKEYLPYFAHDIKQLINLYLPTFNLPLAYLLDQGEPISSFWQKGLDLPVAIESDEIMKKIFKNNYLIR